MPVGTGYTAVGDYLGANRGTLAREDREMSAGTRAPNQPGDPGGSRGGIAAYLGAHTGGNYTGSEAAFDASLMNPTAAPIPSIDNGFLGRGAAGAAFSQAPQSAQASPGEGWSGSEAVPGGIAGAKHDTSGGRAAPADNSSPVDSASNRFPSHQYWWEGKEVGF